MPTIKPQTHPLAHPDHILECEEALEDAMAEIKQAAAEAGWFPKIVAEAMRNLAEAQIDALNANRATDAAIERAKTTRTRH